MDIARAIEQAGDYLMAPLQYLAVAQRMVQPVAQQPAAHAGGAVVEQREKRRRGLAAQGFRQFQISARGGVQPDVLTGALGRHGGDMSERLPLGFARVFEQRAAGADRERQVLAAVTREAGAGELFQQAALAALDIEVPRRQAGEEVAVEHHAVGDQHFRRSDAPQLVVKCLGRNLGDAQDAAREREPGEADGRFVARQREQDIVGFVFQQR